MTYTDPVTDSLFHVGDVVTPTHIWENDEAICHPGANGVVTEVHRNLFDGCIFYVVLAQGVEHCVRADEMKLVKSA